MYPKESIFLILSASLNPLILLLRSTSKKYISPFPIFFKTTSGSLVESLILKEKSFFAIEFFINFSIVERCILLSSQITIFNLKYLLIIKLYHFTLIRGRSKRSFTRRGYNIRRNSYSRSWFNLWKWMLGPRLLVI